MKHRTILAIDPGNIHSAFVVYDGHNILAKGKLENSELYSLIKDQLNKQTEHLAIEMVASYGMAVGASVFDTIWWAGIFAEAYGLSRVSRVYRKEVKMHLCHSMRAKDSNIRQAIIDRYPPTGGGKNPQVGTKSQPGPLFGVSADIWAALAIAITFMDESNF